MDVTEFKLATTVASKAENLWIFMWGLRLHSNI